jgi:hypothetical protein
MSPRYLQNLIKQDFRSSSQVWTQYRDDILNNFATSNYQDLSDHLLREFNRKVYTFGLTGLMFQPFDAGYRFLGSQLEGVFLSPGNSGNGFSNSQGQSVLSPDEGFVFVYINENTILYTNNDEVVQVPEEFA